MFKAHRCHFPNESSPVRVVMWSLLCLVFPVGKSVVALYRFLRDMCCLSETCKDIDSPISSTGAVHVTR